MSLPFHPEAEAIVARQVDAQAKHTTSLWSGMQRSAPEVEDVEYVRQRLIRQAAERRAFTASPRGRFYDAICSLEELGWATEGYDLIGLYRRSISDVREPLDVAAVGACIVILSGINHSDAKRGIEALGELLLEANPQARAA